MSVNKVIIVGRLGGDPELRHTHSGVPVCNLSVATNRRYTDAQGEPKEEVAWHRVVVWGKQGETCATYLHRGRQVYVEGRLGDRKYTDKSGTEQRRAEIVCNRVVFLGDGQRASEPAAAGAPREDDLPF